MSKAQFNAFYKKVGEDGNLKQKMMSLRGDSQSVYAKIVEIAQAEGYEVVPQDVDEAFSDGPVDDAAVAQVAGGGELSWIYDMSNDRNCSTVCAECCGNFLGTYIGKQ